MCWMICWSCCSRFYHIDHFCQFKMQVEFFCKFDKLSYYAVCFHPQSMHMKKFVNGDKDTITIEKL